MLVGAFVLEPKVAEAKVMVVIRAKENSNSRQKSVKRTRHSSQYRNNIISLVYKTMFNSKSAEDYMNEMNRLLKSEPIESLTMAHNYTSPFQTATTNKSSSSPDSISPDSYFDMPFHNRQSELRTRCDTPKPTYYRSEHGSSTNIYDPNSVNRSPNQNMSPRNMFEYRDIFESPPSFNSFYSRDVTAYRNYDFNTPGNTESPFPIRRQRPIVGRKILENTQLTQENETSLHFEGLPLTPPERHHNSYELFPSEKKVLEFNTALKSPVKPLQFDTLSNSSNLSYSMSNYTQNLNNSRLPTFSRIPVSSFSSIDDIGPSTMCTFCRKNGETPVVYMTHCVKKKIGNRHVVTCPVLRSHVCITCGASGDNAHTITYCPVLRSSNNGKPLQSTTITLKNTRVKSNGRRRF